MGCTTRIGLSLGAAAGLALFVSAGTAPQLAAKRFINLDDLPKPNGYTHVVTSPPGRMIFISGQGGRGSDGRMPADFSAQADNTFKNVGRCLEKAGARCPTLRTPAPRLRQSPPDTSRERPFGGAR